MKIILIILSLMTDGSIQRSETVYSDTNSLRAIVDCATASAHLNKIALAKSQSTWAYCGEGQVTK